ncbi:hypothetical protein KS03_5722 (plasmid) [Burkholderia glumae LMG 2196 = ATCC 33617]|nr:hypothetical protein KS03_5722 [Burkholderia glumae LMG 2196 = ATCC 33617]
MRLLKPAFAELSSRPIALLQPPHVPNSLAFAYLGVPVEWLMRLSAPKTADALWCVNVGRNFPRSVEVKFPTLFGR